MQVQKPLSEPTKRIRTEPEKSRFFIHKGNFILI